MSTLAADIDFVTSSDGTRIAYRRMGTGPAVIAIHGGLGSSLSWRAVAERLADRFEFFLVDRRGRGSSEPGSAPHSLDSEVDDAHAVLDVAGPGATVIGHSYGGAVALELARTAEPEFISRLVLYEPGVRVAGLIPDTEVDHLDELLSRGESAQALGRAIEHLDSAGLVRSDGRAPSRALAPIAWTIAREIRALNAAGNDLERYASIQQSVLLLVGASSPGRQQSNCEALAGVLPHVRVERLAGLGHVAHNAAPDTVAALIGDFLADAPRE